MYFLSNIISKKKKTYKSFKKRQAILKRKRRFKNLPIARGGYILYVGDILKFFFRKNYLMYDFEGIILSIKKKKLRSPDTTIKLRNILLGVGIEYSISYFYNRIFFSTLADYKRKRFVYKRSKLYYIRKKKNQASRV